MEEIKVGEYCRTRGGHIHKITKIDNNGLVYWGKISCGWSLEQLKDIIVKHSPNIIDLIEVGDYVISKDGIEGKVDFVMLPLKIFIHGEEILNDDIKSIITKEQIESIKYEV